jgi:ribosomal protein S16
MTTKVRQTVQLLMDRGELGATWREVSTLQAWGHPNTSRILSELHRDGIAARLRAKRDGCSVYVLTEYVQGRETVPHKREQVTVEEQALAGCIEDGAAVAERVRQVVERWGLLTAHYTAMRRIGAELLAALDEPAEEPDQSVLPL